MPDQKPTPQGSGVEEAVEAAAKLLYERSPLSSKHPTWDAFCEWLDGKYANSYRDWAREVVGAIQPFLAQPEGDGGDDDLLDELEDGLREVLADPHAAVGDPYPEEPIENWQARAALQFVAPRLRGHGTDRLYRWVKAEAVGAKNHQRTCEKDGHSREAYAAAGRATALDEVAARLPMSAASPQPEKNSADEKGEWIISDDDGSEPVSHTWRGSALAEVAHRLHRNWLAEGEKGTYHEAREQAEEMLQGAEREPDSRDGVEVRRVAPQNTNGEELSDEDRERTIFVCPECGEVEQATEHWKRKQRHGLPDKPRHWHGEAGAGRSRYVTAVPLRVVGRNAARFLRKLPSTQQIKENADDERRPEDAVRERSQAGRRSPRPVDSEHRDRPADDSAEGDGQGGQRAQGGVGGTASAPQRGVGTARPLDASPQHPESPAPVQEGDE